MRQEQRYGENLPTLHDMLREPTFKNALIRGFLMVLPITLMALVSEASKTRAINHPDNPSIKPPVAAPDLRTAIPTLDGNILIVK